jgi:exodeoxyribonuclease VII large subunit
VTDLFSSIASARAGVFPDDEVWTVSELNETVRALVVDNLPPFWIRGEVSELRAYASGHWYFSLKDAAAKVRCCMWKQQNARVGRPPTDGTEVYAQVRPDFYPARGEFQLVVLTLLPTAALGQHMLELERVKQALAADGLFDPARKRPLPRYAGTIALVTSPDGAALRDLVTVARRRWPAARLLLVPTRVQGAEAEGELVRALGIVNRIEDAELCIVGRGGGSRDDLAVFSSEAVCRALAQVRIPTIAAVGHETDVSLCDFVADYRAPTPSAAMEAAVADVGEVAAAVDQLAARLAGSLTLRTRLARERLARAGDRMQCAVEGSVRARRTAVETITVQLEALSPLRVLQRGYAVARDADGRVLRRVADFPPGRPFRLRVADGDIGARVEPA